MPRRPRDLDLDTGPPPAPPNHRLGHFDYERLDAYAVAREVLSLGETIARGLPPERAHLAEQLRRALLDAFLGVADTATQTGVARLERARQTRASASEAAAALEAMVIVELATPQQVAFPLELLGRLCAMLTRLGTRGLSR